MKKISTYAMHIVLLICNFFKDATQTNGSDVSLAMRHNPHDQKRHNHNEDYRHLYTYSIKQPHTYHVIKKFPLNENRPVFVMELQNSRLIRLTYWKSDRVSLYHKEWYLNGMIRKIIIINKILGRKSVRRWNTQGTSHTVEHHVLVDGLWEKISMTTS